MPFSEKSILPSGGLNKDLDLALVPEGDYLDALNIQHTSKAGQTGYAIQSSYGNKLSFVIPPTTTQNKQYRISLQTSSGTNRSLQMYFPNGGILVPGGNITWTDSTTSTLTYASLASAVSSYFYGSGLTYTLTHSGNYGILTLTSYTGLDYTVVDLLPTTAPTPLLILQEAYDASLTGNAVIIGSFDLLGQLFIYSTPQTQLPQTFTGVVSNITSSSGLIKITTSTAFSFVSGTNITISGTGTNADGSWLITVIDSYNFTLVGSTYATTASTGNITTNVKGIGEIGVSVKDENTGVTTYTTLLKSSELNFRTAYQIDAYGEQNNYQTSNYFTDNLNPPRVFYYLNGPYVANGGLAAVGSTGIYNYGSILSAIRLILANTNISFDFTSQLTTGGGIQSGNWRYAIQLLTENLSATNWSDLSNIVNVYSSDQSGDAKAIMGDLVNVNTSKINVFTISNIPIGVFAYIQLAGVNYVNGAIVGTVIKKVPITNSVMTIEHTGTETGTTTLDVASLLQTNVDIATARNLSAIDNRMVLSNLTASQIIDFSAWAKGLKHSIKQKSISSISSNLFHNTFGEYQDPLNVYGYMGYCIGETYRFMVKFKLRASGTFTQTFWVDDIVINSNSTNITTPNRRVAGLTTLNITGASSNPYTGSGYTAGVSNPLVPYVEFDAINLDYQINGVPLRQLVSEVHFERVERTNAKSVIATGVIAMAYNSPDGVDSPYYGGGSVKNALGPFYGIGVDFNNSTKKYSDLDSDQRQPTWCTFYAPDLFYGEESITQMLGDELVVFGNPQIDNWNNVGTGLTVSGNIAEYNGYFGSSLIIGVNYSISSIYNIADGTSTSSGYLTYIGAGGATPWSSVMRGNSDWLVKGGLVINTGSNVTNYTSNNDFGLYCAYYLRPYTYTDYSNPATSGQYGDPVLNTSVPTGSVIQVPLLAASGSTTLTVIGYNSSVGGNINITVADTSSLSTGMTVVISGVTISGGADNINGTWQIVVQTSSTFRLANVVGTAYGSYTTGGSITPIYTTQSVFGGDVFTQKTFVLMRICPASYGDGMGIGFYSQNTVNSQMVYKNTANYGAWDYPNVSSAAIWTNCTTFYSQDAPYNTGYTYANNISADTTYNPNLPNQTQLPARIVWSDLKPQNAVVDNFRIFLPLNYFDLPMTFGPITHHANFNGELYTWQPRMVQRQYFNTRGTMNVSDGTQVLIGDGTVLSRDGQMVTVIGTNNKWSIVKGKSDQGNDNFYWINTELKQPVRLGYDGTVKIGTIHGMQSFFANNLRFLNGVDTPANGAGICGVWDDRYAAILWTIIGKRGEYNNYDSSIHYTPNTVVFHQPGTYSTFNQTGEFYVAIQASQGYTPDTNPTYWALIPHVNPEDSVTVNNVVYLCREYYNEYTIEYNEEKNKFTTRYTFLPNIYMKWRDTFVTPCPVNASLSYLVLNSTSAVYEHRQGLPGYWYAGTIGIYGIAGNATTGLVTVTTETTHGYATGDTVVVSGLLVATIYNGTWTITVTGTNTFTLVGAAYTTLTESSNGYVSDLYQTNCQADSYITLLFNTDINLSKEYLAIWVASLLTPARFDFYTKNHQSFLVSSDFENNLDFNTSYIKNDILTSTDKVSNNQDTSNLFGQYLQMKMTFSRGVFQKITDLVLKFFAQFRTYNK